MINKKETQERFIDALSAIRRKKKFSQKDIQLAQKVTSRVENHETDPRLSTLITYLASIGYDINDLFKEKSIIKKPTAIMIEHLNLKLKDEGSCLRYIETRKEENMGMYKLKVVDKHIESQVCGAISVTVTFNAMVRDFLNNMALKILGSQTLWLLYLRRVNIIK